jgi:hypothetical protein
MTEATTSMNTITYAHQILIDWLTHVDCMDELPMQLNNKYIIEFMQRMDAIYVVGQPITQDMIESIHIEADDNEGYDDYIYYEEYYYQYIMDRTPPQEDAEVDVDMTSVYALIKTAPMMVTAPAA